MNPTDLCKCGHPEMDHDSAAGCTHRVRKSVFGFCKCKSFQSAEVPSDRPAEATDVQPQNHNNDLPKEAAYMQPGRDNPGSTSAAQGSNPKTVGESPAHGGLEVCLACNGTGERWGLGSPLGIKYNCQICGGSGIQTLTGKEGEQLWNQQKIAQQSKRECRQSEQTSGDKRKRMQQTKQPSEQSSHSCAVLTNDSNGLSRSQDTDPDNAAPKSDPESAARHEKAIRDQLTWYAEGLSAVHEALGLTGEDIFCPLDEVTYADRIKTLTAERDQALESHKTMAQIVATLTDQRDQALERVKELETERDALRINFAEASDDARRRGYDSDRLDWLGRQMENIPEFGWRIPESVASADDLRQAIDAAMKEKV